ncbi:MAG: hypothetical protein L6V82_01675 [Clostridiales bacterium]|nr:MAG: hypothetical protein L6V82_01675 [Clostridiales bacterium]
MKDKIIVITGATRGLGLRLKEDLSKDNVVVTLSRSEVENGKTALRRTCPTSTTSKEFLMKSGKFTAKSTSLSITPDTGFRARPK